jgi:ribosomal protein S18 acetylase RimI-like enzyme
VPRSAARVEEVGPFTLFVGTGAWPYYARPRLGLEHEFTASEVEAVRVRQRELGVPEAFEWVHETTPSLRGFFDGEVLEAPLMVLDRAGWRPPETTATIRILGPDDDLATFRAVQDVAFTHGGTDPGPQGIAERDAQERRDPAFVAQRIRDRLSVAAVAEIAGGQVAAGMHQPVAGVTEIVGVATLPAVRRQGLGGAVTGALVEDALAGGVETVFLSAGSEAVARVYARLGFRRIGTACIVG